jgi:hypothetical protein
LRDSAGLRRIGRVFRRSELRISGACIIADPSE